MTFHPYDPDSYPNAGTHIGLAWRALIDATKDATGTAQLWTEPTRIAEILPAVAARLAGL